VSGALSNYYQQHQAATRILTAAREHRHAGAIGRITGITILRERLGL
jgi:hypothetical protein